MDRGDANETRQTSPGNASRCSPARGRVVVLALVLLATACSSGSDATTTTTDAPSSTTAAAAETRATTDLVLDPNHDYGDLYADGKLPVGDGRFVLDAAKQGYIYLCNEGGGGGGADTRGPWFVNGDTEWDINQKIHVEGEVSWDGRYTATVDGGTRSVSTNAVPNDHATGVFPVQPSDPAYQYDRNPNHIEEQDLVYELTANPQLLDEPACMGGESGVMSTGVPLFNGFDAGNRDAGAWEVQDGCDGHPQMTSQYHYHTLSSCIDDVSVDTVIGWALDGFPITGPKLSEENILTTADLDECHGITSTIELDGKRAKAYHYVMTRDFPYTVSCFRASAIRPPGAGVG